MAAGQTLFDITTRAMMGLDKVLTEEKPDIVLVHGDTTTTFAGALAAYYHQTAVGHVEAGLRTHNKYSPFPEEMNRRLTGCIADLNFAPTSTSEANLLAENVPPESIFVTGNTVIDALHHTVRDDFDFQEKSLKDVDFQNKRIILVTTHRRENLGEPMRHVYKALKQLTEEFDDVEVVFPVHKIRAASRRRHRRSASRSSCCAIRRSARRQSMPVRSSSSARTASASTKRRRSS